MSDKGSLIFPFKIITLRRCEKSAKKLAMLYLEHRFNFPYSVLNLQSSLSHMNAKKKNTNPCMNCNTYFTVKQKNC